MLDPYSRGVLCALSALCILGVVTLSPLRARSSDEHRDIAQTPSRVAPLSVASAIDIVRDPFADRPAVIVQRERPAEVRSLQFATQVLPANLSTTTIPALPQGAQRQTVRVTAVVTGSHPYAMLDTAGEHQIKGLGDRVDGRPIVKIDLDGVTLEGGERLSVGTGDAAR